MSSNLSYDFLSICLSACNQEAYAENVADVVNQLLIDFTNSLLACLGKGESTVERK